MNKINLSIGFAAAMAAGTLAYAAPDLYIAINSEDEVLVINTKTDAITQHISGPISPHGLALSQDGRTLIVGSHQKEKDASGQTMSQLILVSTQDGKIEKEIPMMNWSQDQVTTPDGHYVISTHPNEGRVCVTDLDTRKIISTLDIGKTANHMVLTSDGRHAYVSSGGTNSIVEIDTKDWTITRRLAGGSYPGQMAMTPDGKLIYVVSFIGDELSAVSVEFGTVVQSKKLGMGLHGIDIDADGRLYISGGEERLYVVEPGMGAVKRLALPGDSYEVKVVAAADKIYVSARDKPILWVIDRKTLKLSKNIKLTGVGHHMIVSGAGHIGAAP